MDDISWRFATVLERIGANVQRISAVAQPAACRSSSQHATPSFVIPVIDRMRVLLIPAGLGLNPAVNVSMISELLGFQHVACFRAKNEHVKSEKSLFLIDTKRRLECVCLCVDVCVMSAGQHISSIFL